MPDTFTVTTHESWFSRLGKAIVGVVVGFALFLGAFPLLWWNEGRAVHRARSLEEGAAVVVDVAADPVDAAHDGRLVHVTALATTSDTVTDPEFGITATALRLSRDVETYQWKETSTTETRKKLGGGEEKTTTYRYQKTWSSGHIDSGSFHSRAGHENPPALRWESTSITAPRVTFGAFLLPRELVAKIGHSQPRTTQAEDRQLMAAHGFRSVDGNTFFRGQSPSDPQVGDVRVQFAVTPPETVSIVAAQRGDSFGTYQAKAGSGILLLERGAVPADQMFRSAQTSNTILTWALRAVGFFVMFLGLVMVFRPLSVAGSVIPFLGSLVGAGTGLVSFLLAVVLSLTTIALAWLFYRPLLGGSLLLGAAGALYLLLRSRRRAPVVVPPIPPIPPIPGT